MTTLITLLCCEGDPAKKCYCLLCPHYWEAESQLERQNGYVGTGYGNLNGIPSIDQIRRRVKRNLKEGE